MAETIGVNLVGSAGGFVSAIDSATSSLDRLDKKVGSMGGIGTFLKNTILPAAASIGAAFGASKALAVFGDSDLPGAKRYLEALDASKKAVTALGAAVGEYLAPAAIRVAKVVEWVANKLTPMVRIFTAFSESATQFLLTLASNAVGAFRFMMPVIDDFITKIEGLFSGPGRDWQADIDAFRQYWNDTWDSILSYTAPILVALASLIDTGITVATNLAVAAFESMQTVLGNLGGEGAGAVQSVADAIQNGLVTAISTVEFTLKNLPTVLTIVSDNMTTLWQNAVTAISFFGSEVKSLFTEIFGSDGYIVKLLKELFSSYLPLLLETSILAVRSRLLSAMTNGNLGNANAPFAVAPFVAPGFNWKPGAFPDMKPLGSDASAGFMGGMTDFLKDRLPKVNDMAQMFIDALKFNLPGVTATPNDFIRGNDITRDSESNKSAGLAMEGSKEAYKAILAFENRARDEALDIAKAQLQEQKKTNDALAAVGGLAAGAIP